MFNIPWWCQRTVKCCRRSSGELCQAMISALLPVPGGPLAAQGWEGFPTFPRVSCCVCPVLCLCSVGSLWPGEKAGMVLGWCWWWGQESCLCMDHPQDHGLCSPTWSCCKGGFSSYKVSFPKTWQPLIMRFLYMKHLEFPAQSDCSWKCCLCVAEVLQGFQIENHTYIILFFQNQLQNSPQMGRGSWGQGWDPLGWVSTMEWNVGLGGKIQNCTCQEDEIHVEFKKKKPLCELYVFIKKPLWKTKPNDQ